MRLGDYIDAQRARPFVWGEHDCCTFVFGAVKLRTGIDLMAGWPAYATRRGAAEALRAHGAGTLLETVRAHMGEIPPARARDWDVVMASNGALGICCGRLSAFLGEDGVEARPTLAATHAFATGRDA